MKGLFVWFVIKIIAVLVGNFQKEQKIGLCVSIKYAKIVIMSSGKENAQNVMENFIINAKSVVNLDHFMIVIINFICFVLIVIVLFVLYVSINVVFV
jgi:hypothetical protein